MNSKPHLQTIRRDQVSATLASEPNQVHAPGRRTNPARASDRLAELNEWIGGLKERRRVKRTVVALLDIIELSQLQTLKDAKAYKGHKALLDTGEVKTIEKWDDFCDLIVGLSRPTVDESLKNFNALGANFMEALQDHGVPSSKLRQFRQASLSEREQLLIAARAGDVEAVEAFCQDIALRHSEERKAAEEQKQKELVAKDRVIETKERHIRTLQEEAERRTAAEVEKQAKASSYAERRKAREETTALVLTSFATLVGLVDEELRTALEEHQIDEARNSLDFTLIRQTQELARRGISIDLTNPSVPDWREHVERMAKEFRQAPVSGDA